MKIRKLVSSRRIEYRDENDNLHREDGPAVEIYGEKDTYTGYKAWWQNGWRHRSDGPAIEYPSGEKEWFFNGRENRFYSEVSLENKLHRVPDVKQFFIDNCMGLDPGEIFLLRLVIINHFSKHLDFLDKLLILQ